MNAKIVSSRVQIKSLARFNSSVSSLYSPIFSESVSRSCGTLEMVSKIRLTLAEWFSDNYGEVIRSLLLSRQSLGNQP